MDFDLSSEQEAIFDAALSFGQNEIAPYAQTWEEDGAIPREVLQAAAEMGFAALYVAEEDGGAGLSRLDATLVFEALSRACPSVAAFISIHNMCTNMVAKYGSDTLKAAYMDRLISMDAIAAYCLTEPGSGSDAAALRTKAEADDGGIRLTGTKAFISGGSFSDLYVVMARSGDAGPKGISTYVVPDGAAGLSFGALEKKMGWKSQPTAQVQFDGVVIPADHQLGQTGKGFSYAMEGLDGGRLNIAACALGGAEEALRKALAYTGERAAFGKHLNEFQSIQFKLADMLIRLEASRVFLHQAAWSLDAGRHDATERCAMAKRFVTETAYAVTDDALQLFGGYGYLADYGIEKILRDLRVHRILEGTNEIMQLIVARSLIAEKI